jgi:hypothetical protein
VVGIDHKPLVGLYAEVKALADIENPRLWNLAEKAGRYRFRTFHIPGIVNNIPDSLSRYPVGAPEHLNLEGRTRTLRWERCPRLSSLGEGLKSG